METRNCRKNTKYTKMKKKNNQGKKVAGCCILINIFSFFMIMLIWIFMLVIKEKFIQINTGNKKSIHSGKLDMREIALQHNVDTSRKKRGRRQLDFLYYSTFYSLFLFLPQYLLRSSSRKMKKLKCVNFS